MPEFSSKTKLARLYVLVLSLKQVGTRKAGERRMDREKKAARKSELFSQLEESDTFWCPDCRILFSGTAYGLNCPRCLNQTLSFSRIANTFGRRANDDKTGHRS
jgi:rubrerythrin